MNWIKEEWRVRISMRKKGQWDAYIEESTKGVEKNEQTKQIKKDCMKTQRLAGHVYNHGHNSLNA